jgi:hypothetical protein
VQRGEGTAGSAQDDISTAGGTGERVVLPEDPTRYAAHGAGDEEAVAADSGSMSGSGKLSAVLALNSAGGVDESANMSRSSWAVKVLSRPACGGVGAMVGDGEGDSQSPRLGRRGCTYYSQCSGACEPDRCMSGTGEAGTIRARSEQPFAASRPGVAAAPRNGST